MARSALTGSRIRERRMLAGMKQADLAQQIGISASYLNLIEHNRRRIGEGLLRRIASVLGLDPAVLSEGAEAGLIAALREAVASNEGSPVPELDRMEEFVGRFPGWAALIAGQRERLQLLERTVEAMSDRMSHDPYLSASLHEVLSAVTSVRSAATILAETEDLEPEWQARFQRNLRQDAERLTEGAGALVAYLDGSVGEDGRLSPPQEEVEAWLALRAYRLPELEDGKARPAQLAAAAGLGSASARRILQHWLERYESDARRLPLTGLLSHYAATGGDPAAIARRTGGDLALVLRRLAVLPDDPATPGAHQAGLAICDGAGALIFRKPLEGFAMPRFGAACPLWPLYQALARPGQPIRARVEMEGRGARPVLCYAICQPVSPPDFELPAVLEAVMLILPDPGETPEPVQPVGPTCRICARHDCPARREPSVLTEEF